DVERAGREATRLRCAFGTQTPERFFDGLQPSEQRARGERGLDRHHAVEIPAALPLGAAGLLLPRLRLVDGRGVDDADLAARAQPAHGRAHRVEAVAEVAAQAQIDARHTRRRVSSTDGVPTSPWSGGVSLRTRTRTSSAGNSRSNACAICPARRSMRFTRPCVPISTMRRATCP